MSNEALVEQLKRAAGFAGSTKSRKLYSEALRVILELESRLSKPESVFLCGYVSGGACGSGQKTVPMLIVSTEKEAQEYISRFHKSNSNYGFFKELPIIK